MRVDFGGRERQKSFFRRSKPHSLPWRDFYAKVLHASSEPFSFRAFGHWYKGERLPTLVLVRTICTMSNLDFSRLDVKIREDKWGQAQGGKKRIELYGCNLNKKDRILGGKAARRLLITNLGVEYSQFMFNASSKGGTSSVISKKGFTRKVIGPRGERMFNQLEKDVAEALSSASIDYQYEPVLSTGGRTIIPDFKVRKLIIECTEWSNAKPKATSVRKRLARLSLGFPELDFLVVTTANLKKRYAMHLGETARVLSIDEFRLLTYRMELPHPDGKQNRS